jgi:hypothetical protein
MTLLSGRGNVGAMAIGWARRMTRDDQDHIAVFGVFVVLPLILVIGFWILA